MTRIDPPIYLWTEKGFGWAHFVSDPGLETDLIWTVFLDDGEIWCAPNNKVRAVTNWTAGREVKYPPRKIKNYGELVRKK